MNFENKQNNSHIVFVMFTRVALRITSLTGQHFPENRTPLFTRLRCVSLYFRFKYFVLI